MWRLELDRFTGAMLGGAVVVALGAVALSGSSNTSLSGTPPTDAPPTSEAPATTSGAPTTSEGSTAAPATAEAAALRSVVIIDDGSFPSVSGDELLTDGSSIAAIEDERSDGAGFLTAGTDGRTLGDLVESSVSADDSLVVVFGGIADAEAGADLLAIGDAALSAIERVQAVARRADIVLVGPISAPEDLTSVDDLRNVLRAVADEADVDFRDPIGEAWLVDGDLDPDGSMTATGERRVTTEVQRIVRSRLDD